MVAWRWREDPDEHCRKRPEPAIYTAVALAVKAKVIVELGTGVCVSSYSFLKALKLTDGFLYSIDINADEPIKSAIEWLKDEPRVTFIHGDSVEVGESWDKGKIDVLLCDSDHSYQWVLKELRTWGKYNPKAILVHDTVADTGKIGDGVYDAAVEYAEETGRMFFHLVDRHPGVGMIV